MQVPLQRESFDSLFGIDREVFERNKARLSLRKRENLILFCVERDSVRGRQDLSAVVVFWRTFCRVQVVIKINRCRLERLRSAFRFQRKLHFGAR